MRKFLMAAMLFLSSCTNKDAARSALEAHGFEDINWTGYAMFACSGDDFSKTGFIATGPSGSRVEGTVCCGLIFKDCTVRIR